MMNKEQKWIEKHPITWLLMQKIGEFCGSLPSSLSVCFCGGRYITEELPHSELITKEGE